MLKLITFPFAGGNKYSFNYLREDLFSNDIELCVLEYPGRGNRIREALLFDIHQVVEDGYNRLKELTGTDDYILYGHSMGTLVSYLVCQKLQKDGLKMPVRLVVSGRGSPAKEKDEKIAHLPSEEFWDKINELGGLPEEVLKEKGLRSFFEPIIRADFQCIEEYIHTATEKLGVPIDVFYGAAEKITEEEILGWNEESAKEVRIKQLEGDHFFIYNYKDFFVNFFSDLAKQQRV